MTRSILLAADREWARLHRKPTVHELNKGIEQAQLEVEQSKAIAKRAEEEVQRAKKLHRENHLVDLVRNVFGDVK